VGRVNCYKDTLYYKYKHSTTGLKITEEKVMVIRETEEPYRRGVVVESEDCFEFWEAGKRDYDMKD
jgi:hypothetical protein